MAPKSNLIGIRYGRLLVIEECIERKNGHVVWVCKCNCKNKTICKVTTSNLKSKHSTSCGCKRLESVSSHKLSNHKLYSIWRGMKQRCYNKKHTRYVDWGGRGIIVCKEWKNNFLSFYNWAISNGYGKNLTIDRENNDGNYNPKNCRWITKKAQSFNRRRKKKFKNRPVGIVKSGKNYGAQIKIDNKQIWIGTYKTKFEAIKARNDHIKNNNLPHRLNKNKDSESPTYQYKNMDKKCR